jgi:5-methylcytosine-specific restriction endonuclease McrA
VPQRPSQHATNVAYYWRNREREIQRVRARQGATVALLRDFRKGPCADCGAMFKPNQMDFDHRNPAEKSFRLTEGRAMLMSRGRLLSELTKCDVVCANCHRIRTHTAHIERVSGHALRRGASRYIERKRARWREQALLLNHLRDVPCADCGRRFPPCAMDFDHRDPASKRFGVTRMVGRAGTASMLAEAAKCDIVCANCHRSRTLIRRERLSERE